MRISKHLNSGTASLVATRCDFASLQVNPLGSGSPWARPYLSRGWNQQMTWQFEHERLTVNVKSTSSKDLFCVRVSLCVTCKCLVPWFQSPEALHKSVTVETCCCKTFWDLHKQAIRKSDEGSNLHQHLVSQATQVALHKAFPVRLGHSFWKEICLALPRHFLTSLKHYVHIYIYILLNVQTSN